MNIAIDNNSKNPSIFYLRGIVRGEGIRSNDEKIFNAKGEIIDLTKAIRIKPRFYNAYYHSGKIKESSGDFLGAKNDYSYVIKLDHKFIPAHKKRSNIYFTLKAI